MKEDCVLLEKPRKLQRVAHVLCALCALGFKKNGKVRKLERYITALSSIMGIDITTYRIRIGRFGPGRVYISTGIAEIYSSSITGSDINYKTLATMVLLTFLLKCCVITQQEVISYVYMFIRLWELTSASCQSMVHIAIYVNLYTRIRAVRPNESF